MRKKLISSGLISKDLAGNVARKLSILLLQPEYKTLIINKSSHITCFISLMAWPVSRKQTWPQQINVSDPQPHALTRGCYKGK
jgi:hypothetical protein